MINANRVDLWREDIEASVSSYNSWFFEAAPEAYRETRQSTIDQVKNAFKLTKNMTNLTPNVLGAQPDIISALRMMTSPPLARDRLIGLGGLTSSAMVKRMESGGLPTRMPEVQIHAELSKICETLTRLLDRDLMNWLDGNREPEEAEVNLAAMVVADRLCGSIADPIIRNAQEQRQLAAIGSFLDGLGYKRQPHSVKLPLAAMSRGTYSFRQVVSVGDDKPVNMPIDVVIQPINGHASGLPILVEAKSAGDFTNTNKRRKEEAQKYHQLKTKYGGSVQFLLFLNGYFDAGYLGYEAAEGIDWIWEHRIEDFLETGL